MLALRQTLALEHAVAHGGTDQNLPPTLWLSSPETILVNDRHYADYTDKAIPRNFHDNHPLTPLETFYRRPIFRRISLPPSGQLDRTGLGTGMKDV